MPTGIWLVSDMALWSCVLSLPLRSQTRAEHIMAGGAKSFVLGSLAVATRGSEHRSTCPGV